MSLDDTIRLRMEREIDSILSDPVNMENAIRRMLISQGIEPTLETTLSNLIGYCTGVFISYYSQIYGRVPNKQEAEEFDLIMKRRAGEMRDAFIRSRINES